MQLKIHGGGAFRASDGLEAVDMATGRELAHPNVSLSVLLTVCFCPAGNTWHSLFVDDPLFFSIQRSIEAMGIFIF